MESHGNLKEKNFLVSFNKINEYEKKSNTLIYYGLNWLK